MTLGEAKGRISEIIQACGDFQSSMNSIQNALTAFADDVNSTVGSIASDISEPTIVSNCTNAANNIASSINSTMSLTNEALSVLSTDATNKIREIVDEYNNSLDADSTEERLSYVEVSLTGAAGSVALSSYSGGQSNSLPSSSTGAESSNPSPIEETPQEETTDSGDTDSGSNYTGGSSYSGGSDYSYDAGTTDDTSSQTQDMDYYFGLLGSSGVNSTEIENWDTLVKTFLTENGLDSYITKIELINNKIKITLSNGKEVELENITTKTAFLEKVEEILKEENLK